MLDEMEALTYERGDGLVTQVSGTRMRFGTTEMLGVTTATYDGVCDWIDPHSLVP